MSGSSAQIPTVELDPEHSWNVATEASTDDTMQEVLRTHIQRGRPKKNPSQGPYDVSLDWAVGPQAPASDPACSTAASHFCSIDPQPFFKFQPDVNINAVQVTETDSTQKPGFQLRWPKKKTTTVQYNDAGTIEKPEHVHRWIKKKNMSSYGSHLNWAVDPQTPASSSSSSSSAANGCLSYHSKRSICGPVNTKTDEDPVVPQTVDLTFDRDVSADVEAWTDMQYTAHAPRGRGRPTKNRAYGASMDWEVEPQLPASGSTFVDVFSGPQKSRPDLGASKEPNRVKSIAVLRKAAPGSTTTTRSTPSGQMQKPTSPDLWHKKSPSPSDECCVFAGHAFLDWVKKDGTEAFGLGELSDDGW